MKGETLQRVLELTKLTKVCCCRIYKGGRYISEGILSDLLPSDTRIRIRIERYSLVSDEYGVYLLLHIALKGEKMKETLQIVLLSLLAVLSIIALPTLYLFGF